MNMLLHGLRPTPLDLARLLGEPPPVGPAIGLEHEYTVRRAVDGLQVDFARIVHHLGLGRPRLDPDDPNAYRLPSGAVVTADKREAEIALPPTTMAPGFAQRIGHAADIERQALEDRLPGTKLTGYSTHISVEVPEGLEVEVARLYVNRFGPAMLLAMDGPEAPGLRIRPRHGRLELCGDFVAGSRLEHALELAAGSVARCVAARTGSSDPATVLPAAIRHGWLPAIERRGWFIDRRLIGLGGVAGTAGTVELVAGERIAAAKQVAEATALALGALDSPRPAGATTERAGGPNAFGDLLRTRHRRGFDLAPVMATWPLTVFVAAPSGRAASAPAFVVIPRRWLRLFLQKLDRGELDGALRQSLRGKRGAIPAAETSQDASRPGLFSVLGPRLALLPGEPM